MQFLDVLYIIFKVLGQAITIIPELLEKYNEYKMKAEYKGKKAAAEAAINDYYTATYSKNFQAGASALHNLATGSKK